MLGTFDLTAFTLILMRMFGFILFNPILSRTNIPKLMQTAMALTLALIVYTGTTTMVDITFVSYIDYGITLIFEMLIGFVIGFIITLFTTIIIMGGELIDMQLGLSMSKIFDPQTNISLSLSATFFNMMFNLTFFLTNSHLYLFNIFIKSGEIIDYANVTINQHLSEVMFLIFYDCIRMSVQLALPFIVTAIIMESAVGILMKTVPQINVFVVNMQVKILIGFSLLIIITPPVSDFIGNLMDLMFEAIESVLMYL